jgi:hypothetical protein
MTCYDIANNDWPSVRGDIEAAFYRDLEPLPVGVEDLAALAASRPPGAASTGLNWGRLTPEDFERLLWRILDDAPGYENVRLLTRMNAADRGQDVSAERTRSDALSGVTREFVIVQCKHWQARSVGVRDRAVE